MLLLPREVIFTPALPVLGNYLKPVSTGLEQGSAAKGLAAKPDYLNYISTEPPELYIHGAHKVEKED